MKPTKSPFTTKPQTPGTLAAYYGANPGVRPLHVNEKGLGMALRSIDLENPDKKYTILCDLGAATGHIVQPWFQDNGEAIHELGILTTIISPLTSNKLSAQNLFQWASAIGVDTSIPVEQRPVRWVVCYNQFLSKEFPYYDESTGGSQFKTDFQPAHMTLRKRDDDTEITLKGRNLSNHQAVMAWKAREFDRLGPVLKHIDSYLHYRSDHEKIQKEFDSIRALLVPTETHHRLVLVCAGQGGVGKSTIARGLVDYYLDDETENLVLFDGETELF